MSSILDALKKLEQDKQEKEQSDQLEIDTLAAERDLFHRKRGAGRDTIHVSSVVLAGGVLLFAVALVCVSVITALLIVNAAPVPQTSTAQVAQSSATTPAAPAEQQGSPRAAAPAEPAPPDSISVAPATAETEPAPAPEPLSEAPRPEQPVSAPTERVQLAASSAPRAPKPEPVEEPAPRARQEKPPAPRLEPPAAVQTAPPAPVKPVASTAGAPDPAFGDIDLSVLPILSESERVRLGLPPLRVNIVGLPTKRQPRPSALINYEKVYVGEYISNTNARLVDVELRGVGLSVGGQLYFLPK